MLIRTKLILRFTLLVAGLLVAFSAFVYFFQAESRAVRFRHRLQGKAVLAARVLIRGGHLAAGMRSHVRPHDLLTIAGEEIRISGPAGQLLYLSPPISASAERETVQVPYVLAGQTYQVVVSAVDELGRANQSKLGLVLVVGNVGALLLIIGAGWFFANEFLRPVARVVEQVEQITASNLSRRVDEGNRRDEIARLAITFNQMLTGVEQAFEAQKSFLSHASHELRTPLATLLGTLETALAYDKTLADSQESITSGLEDVQHLIKLTNGILALARADGPLPHPVPARLDECLAQAISFAQAKYPGRELRLSFGPHPIPALSPDDPAAGPFGLPGNPELLTTALFNLLDNACKYSTAAVVVELAYADAHTLRVRVTDVGPGIAPADQVRLFEPLFRARSAAGRPGFGLGLPLTQKIIRSHGGRVAVESVLGQGTVATVWLPV